MELVGRVGVFSVRVEDITERCDVAKGAFYNYFESKDALLAELLARGVDILERRYLDVATLPASMPERVRELARRHDRFFDDHPAQAILFHQGRGLLQLGPEGAHQLRATFEGYLARLWLALAPGEQGPPDPRRLDLAAAFAGAVAGYRSFRLASGMPPSGETAANLLALALPAALGGSPDLA